MTDISAQIEEQLFLLHDDAYKTFQASLIPTVPPSRIIGVRVPRLRQLAKEMTRNGSAALYLQKASLPHTYYDEDNLHAFLIAEIRDFDCCLTMLNRFLPYVDNWATCDMMNPGVLKNHPKRCLEAITCWLKSSHIYTVRFGLAQLMRHYLGNTFHDGILCLAAGVSENKAVSDDYYVRMMQAWFFAEALTRQYDAASVYLLQRKLPVWVHNKTIQKARESRRISPETKEYLNSLKI